MLQTYFMQYKPFLVFLAKFLSSYIVLTLLYQWYLDSFDTQHFETDGITHFVSKNTVSLLELFGRTASIVPNVKEPCYNLFLDGKWIVRIVEGCNGVSVMILFTAFVVAFSAKWGKTLLFILFGIVTIHIFNVLRIALLSMALLRYKEYGSFLHDIAFPLFIYGYVFALWLFWVRKFSAYAVKGK